MTKYADMAKVMERAGKLFEGKTQHEITSIFESAIEDGSLHMIYQPCFTKDRELLGFEAFMRFEHGKDLIPPQVFLSAAENADYINRIGGFSIDQSLKALALFDANRPEGTKVRRIYMFDRGSSLDFLLTVPQSFMLDSPVPDSLCGKYGLVQRRCEFPDNCFRDMLIYPSGKKLSGSELALVNKLYEIRNETAFKDYT